MACSRLNFTFTEPACTISSTIERQRNRERKTGERNKELKLHVLNGS
jgi:hypothetical protein